MKYELVRDVILQKAKEEFGVAELYGENSNGLIANPNEGVEHLPWRYSYNLPTQELRILEQEQMDEFYYPIYNKVMNQRFQNGKCAEFEKIYIATTNICNGKCGFCPAGLDKTLSPQYIPDEIIQKIISELKEISFTGKISLHGVNEPLTDKRIVEICKKFKQNLPNCKLQILTNGKLLTLTILKQLIEVVDKIDIHIYDDDLNITEKSKELIDFLENNKYSCEVMFFLRKEHEILSQKGYGPCGRDSFSKIKSGCIMPFTTLSILANGDISYCDSDYKGIGSMGNIADNTIMEIWNCQKFNEYREKMLQGRQATEFCNKCDFF